jgi:hypothetical protein
LCINWSRAAAKQEPLADHPRADGHGKLGLHIDVRSNSKTASCGSRLAIE